ncbi:MAG: helix-turn-helix domain-containing protein [Acidobacteria bacterium]|nr:helix-turn-helix domain-containing protein [Acidobacteriota bacterium]
MMVDEEVYGRLLAKYVPAVIETDEEQERLSRALMHLTIPQRELSPEEMRLASLLGHLVEDYERRVNERKVKHFSPAERLRYLIAEHGLRQSNLASMFGGQSVVSEVLSGKRRIHLNQARRLAARFGVPVDAFITK